MFVSVGESETACSGMVVAGGSCGSDWHPIVMKMLAVISVRRKAFIFILLLFDPWFDCTIDVLQSGKVHGNSNIFFIFFSSFSYTPSLTLLH